MNIPNVHAPRNEDDVESQSVTPVALDDRNHFLFESFDDSFWRLSGCEKGDHSMNKLQISMSQPACALHGEYANVDSTIPMIGDFDQNFMPNGEHHEPSSLLPFGSEWFQHQHSISGLNFPFQDTEGIQDDHSSLLLANDEQDAMTILEDTYADDFHHRAIVGGDVRDSRSTPASTASGDPNILRCQHHVQGQPCGVLIKGGFPGILKHFACIHVRPRISANTRSDHPSEFWICRWGGKCDSCIRKEGFKRHVLGHLVRWKCSTCPLTYSRDDSARKHAKDCGDGRIIMVPRLEGRPRRL
ncbi:uncharacterized protein EDB93DRAFT_459144 [Suillus bovinus]|uniref:uncharacterized protein n=1 Tax=Suillus bovinus TaxID=48563 RepID=UPI001B87DD5F|nr:uncharacterized protein EDB93DRAFT_459144 [Suillus bovinus]KAG2146961.1 hypothetical protein EDB93DRAFT_459144 [Suillus bovinus]